MVVVDGEVFEVVCVLAVMVELVIVGKLVAVVAVVRVAVVEEVVVEVGVDVVGVEVLIHDGVSLVKISVGAFSKSVYFSHHL